MLFVGPTALDMLGRPIKQRRLHLPGLTLPMLAALTPDHWDATLVNETVQDIPYDEPWDLVITVCDNARETCPFIPGTAARSHWGMSDPAQVTGPEDARRAFQKTFDILRRRIDMLISLPVHLLTQEALAQRVTEIAHLVPEQPDVKGAAGVN